jgi:hypothetical protein
MALKEFINFSKATASSFVKKSKNELTTSNKITSVFWFEIESLL